MSTSPHANRPLHHRALAIIAAPLAHAHHRRYHGVPHHLVFDTFLNIVIYVLLAAAIIMSVVKVVGGGPTLNWEFPEIVSGASIEATLTVTGAPSGTINDLVVTPTFPSSWIVTGEPAWIIGDLPAGQTRTRTFRLEINSAVNHSTTVQTAVVWSTFRLRINTTHVLRVTPKSSVFDLELTTAPTTDGVGTTTMRIVQRSGRALDGIRVALISSPQITIEEADKDFDGVTWVPGVVPADVPTEKVVSWKTASSAGTKLQFYATLSYQTIGDPITMVERSVETIVQRQPSGPETDNTGTQPSIVAEARYRSATGISFGYGPHPPRVGQETVYRMFWYVRPGSTQATEVTVSAVLPAGVTWKGRESLTGGQRVTYNATSRRITWTIGTVNADDGPMMASFDLGVRPVTKDRGRTAQLLGITTISSRMSSRVIQSTSSAMTTDAVDGGQPGSGIVR